VPTTVLQTTTLQTTALRTTTTLQTTTPGTTAEAVPEDVLVDTIPDRVLLNTGGMSLLGFAALVSPPWLLEATCCEPERGAGDNATNQD
jgi:hypothetical protein